MEDSYKLVGSAVGHYGTYTFYKALRITRNGIDRIIAIGDFFFVKLWQDSELLAIGELQLLWTDRGAGRNLASLRLYVLPENTHAGRSNHGEDEVIAMSERVVVRAEELLNWVCDGRGWRWGLRATWAGDCIPIPEIALPSSSAPPPLPASSKFDFSDIDKEKAEISDPSATAVVIFSYPRYCRYRAMVRRLDGIAEHWLHDPLVATLGGYAAPTKDTRILYCRETFEYPELEGHEFVCNHMAPRLKGRGVRGRKRRARSASRSSASDSSTSINRAPTPQGVKSGLRSSAPSPAPSQTSTPTLPITSKSEERMFMQKLRTFCKSNNTSMAKISYLSSKVNLYQLYVAVVKEGGFDEVLRPNGWKRLLSDLGAPSTSSHASFVRRHYERLLLPFERFEKGLTPTPSKASSNGSSSNSSTPVKHEKKKLNSHSVPIATIDISDSPIREISHSINEKSSIPRLRTPPPTKKKKSDHLLNGKKSEKKRSSHDGFTDKERRRYEKMKAKAEANAKENMIAHEESDEDHPVPVNHFDPSNILNLNIDRDEDKDYIKVTMSAVDLNQEFLDSLPKAEETEPVVEQPRRMISVVPPEKLMGKEQNPIQGLLGLANAAVNGSSLPTPDKSSAIRSRPSSLRSVRVKPGRQGNSSNSPPAATIAPPPLPTIQPIVGISIDDDIIEVPYKPKSPEIIDLDLYESPESPQSAKRKKLDILKRGGLEVTTVRGCWPVLDPAFQQQILNRAQFHTMYNAFTPGTEGFSPPKVTQGKSIYGSCGPEKTVYGNPKDPFMPPPHVLQGAAPRKMCSQRSPVGVEVLDLTIKPAVEIMRVPGITEHPQNLTAKKIVQCVNNEPRQINPALEITLVAKNKPPRPPQKRSSTGKFMSNKTPYVNATIPGLMPRNQNQSPKNHTNHSAAANLVIPNYQVSSNTIGSVSPVANNTLTANITSSLLQGAGGTLLQIASSSSKATPTLGSLPLASYLDNPLYVSALYSTLTGQINPVLPDQHKLAHMYNEFVSGNLLNRYPGMTTPPGVVATPTSKT